MIQRQNNFSWRLGLSISLLVGGVSASIKCVIAQPIPDETLGTESSIINNVDGTNSTQVDGGATRGSNLFHSFKQFNIGEEQKVLFNSPPGISNILTRVTGGSPSEILGSLGVIGDANLFLINPNGITFGANAKLDLKGSFIASTASSAIFSDGIQYSATNPQAASLLIVNTPTGLQYQGTETSIRVQGVRLAVQPGQTLGLIGGEVNIEGGRLIAPSGRIEVGSVANNSVVSLNPTAKGWLLGYENVSNFQDIFIIKRSFNRFASTLNASGGSGGDISLQGKQILLTDNSQVLSTTDGVGTGGNLVVNASELFLIKGRSSNLSSLSTATGRGGDITVNTGKLILEDGAGISTDSSALVEPSGNIRSATGNAGNLTVNALISVELKNGGSLSSGTQASGNAGDIKINTANLIVDGSKSGVAVSSSGTGDAGNLMIAARTISLNNEGQLTATSEAGKGGGNITLQDLESLILRGKSEVSTNAGEGNGGNITIGTKLLTVLGNSKITANAQGSGNGGNVRIKTKGLFLSPNSEISATSERGVDGVVEIDRLENDPEGALLTLPAEPVNISGLIAQGCSSGGGSVARSSKFVVTGRGGLPPTPKEAFRGDVALADLGKPIEIEATQAKVIAPTNQKPPELNPLVEAQGWVIGSKGEVILTASAPNVTPFIPWMKSSSCHG
ncbi:two-partner secretion domain-containing protein [Chlorogloea sp. CCALA 695]|uniref:two-partner secretion domain-containing protein n=1 Tax=Chlorogloea sp. CCALA 695 TaxID=2107693 RepID=UPI000D05E9EA|nr:filamentous hemagglutinin N-terminal domain-containing protein [Chlorogloea sp. CCALA 695]PSB29666.1 filamentous hemagglutinin [Chlorogloea sp. CCALA 695]